MFAVVDQLIGASGLGDSEFFGAAGSSDHPCAHGLADFHCRQSDTARRTQHQQGFAGLELAALLQSMHRGAVSHAKGGCTGEVHLLRNWQHVVGGYCHLFGKTPPAGQGHDPVTDFEIGDLFTHRADDAGSFATGREGQ
ncbi:hypothetical protein D3C80_1439690 [compost metagenome]